MEVLTMEAKASHFLRLLSLYGIFWTAYMNNAAALHVQDLSRLNLQNQETETIPYPIIEFDLEDIPVGKSTKPSLVLTSEKLRNSGENENGFRAFLNRSDRRKRSSRLEELLDENVLRLNQPTYQIVRRDGGSRTIHLPPSFIPRLGKRQSNNDFL